jgi:hypothetical protein
VRTSFCVCGLTFPNNQSDKLPSDKEFPCKRARIRPQFCRNVVRIAPNLNATSRTLVGRSRSRKRRRIIKTRTICDRQNRASKPKPRRDDSDRRVKTEGETNKVFVIKDGRAEERIVKTGFLENDLIEFNKAFRKTNRSRSAISNSALRRRFGQAVIKLDF